MTYFAYIHFEWISFKSVFTALVIIIDIITLFSIVWRSQGVERTLSWLFAVIAFPVLGAFLYFFLTHQPVKLSRKLKRKSNKIVKETITNSGNDAFLELNEPILNLAFALTGLEASTNNEIEILTESEYAFDRIKDSVKSAKKSIWVEYYIIKRDKTGRNFLKLLADMAKSGIDVKILYDAYGTSQLHKSSVKAIRNAGGRVEAFNPFNPFRRRWSFQLRNHRKLIIIDGNIGFTGGMNVGDQYSGRSRRHGGAFYRDTHLLIKGPAVADLAQVFREDWAYTTSGELLPQFQIPTNAFGKTILAILPSSPDQLQNATALVYFQALNQAKTSIYLTSPYFIPDEPIIRAIESAVLRGVEVQILIPMRSDIILARHAARSHMASLISIGVKFYEYKPSMLHSKILIVDDSFCIVGSANLDIRSFRLNFELNALIFDKSIAKELTERFKQDIRQSKLIEAKEFAKRSKIERFKERIARLLSPLL